MSISLNKSLRKTGETIEAIGHATEIQINCVFGSVNLSNECEGEGRVNDMLIA